MQHRVDRGNVPSKRTTTTLPLADATAPRFGEVSRLFIFHCGRVFAPARGAIAAGAMQQRLLRRSFIGLLAFPDFQSRLLNGAGKRK